MASGERSPIEGIVDIDSLAVWAREYRAASLTDPRVKRLPYNVFPEGDELIGQEGLNIYGFPWESAPASLQEILAMQFESAERPEIRKFVYGMVKEDQLQLELRSTDVKGMAEGIFDFYAETYSLHGVVLDFTNSALLPTLPSTKGVWQISKIPGAEHMQFRQILGDLRHTQPLDEERTHLFERLARTLNPSDITIPTTVDQLRDVARFLVLARPYRAITVFGAKNDLPPRAGF